jgi:hypothetical protein
MTSARRNLRSYSKVQSIRTDDGSNCRQPWPTGNTTTRATSVSAIRRRVKGQRCPLGLQVAVGERLGKLRGTKGAELVVQQAELTVEAGSDELIFGLAAPPLARLRCGIDHKVLLLQRLDSPNLLQ